MTPNRRIAGTRSLLPILAPALLALALVAGCRSQDAAPATDSQLARDLELASTAPLGAAPVFQDTALAPAGAPDTYSPPAPAAPVPSARDRAPARSASSAPQRAATPVTRRPAARTPAPAPRPDPAPAPVREVAEEPAPGPSRSPSIGAGTRIALTSDSRVCTSSRPGDKITGTVSETVYGSDGARIPRGSVVVLEVASVTPGDPPENSRITFRVRAISVDGTSYPASGSGGSTSALERVQTGRSTSSDRNKVIGGAIAGAVLGRVLGGDTRSTVAGAAAGAATGAVVASRSGGFEGCMSAGSPVEVTLGGALAMGG